MPRIDVNLVENEKLKEQVRRMEEEILRLRFSMLTLMWAQFTLAIRGQKNSWNTAVTATKLWEEEENQTLSTQTSMKIFVLVR